MNSLSSRKTHIRICTIIAVMVLLVAGICCGCNLSTSKASSSITLYDASEMSNGKEFNETANALYKICFEQPEVLAATMSAFPHQLQEFGIILNDPEVAPMIIEELVEGEDGDIIQLALLGMLKSLLESPSTKFASGEWTGPTQMLCMGQYDPDAVSTPENIYLYWKRTDLTDAKVFGMVVGDQPENYEHAYFYLEGGFQRFVPIIE